MNIFKKALDNLFVSILFMLPTLIILSLFFLLNPYRNKELNAEIKKLKQENKILIKKNDSIYSSIRNLDFLKKQSDIKISEYQNQEAEQQKRLSKLNNDLNNLKKKYEKANNHAANFSSADIQRYFTDSIK